MICSYETGVLVPANAVQECGGPSWWYAVLRWLHCKADEEFRARSVRGCSICGTVLYTPDLDTRQLKTLITPSEVKENTPKPCLSLKRTKNLGQMLVRAKLKDVIDPPMSTEAITINRSPYLDGRSAMCGTFRCKCNVQKGGHTFIT